jgi:uncharacterized protein with LGFP repeats
VAPEGAGDKAAGPGHGLIQVAHLQAPSTKPYSMIGVTWDDPAAGQDLVVEVRTHGNRGWTDWTALEHDDDHAPSEARADGARGGTAPLWVGDSRGVQVRVLAPRAGVPAGLDVALVDPGEGPDTRLMAASLAPMPSIITRRQWGADPRMSGGCWSPIHGPTVDAVVVHHTVNSNSYTRAESDNIVRGIYAYHTQSQGWCDIGYNFLIDRYGQIFEGRAGGIRTPVRGAHAGVSAVNEATTGVSMIGNFDTGWPTRAMKDALVNFVAWRVQTYYRDPHGTTVIGGTRYPVIMGHRNVHSTACPGQHLYDWLPTLRNRVLDRIGTWKTPIYYKWQREGGARGWLGDPYRGERNQSGARNTQFTHGRIYWSSTTGARAISGPILSAYGRNGGAAGLLGLPKSDVRDAGANSQRTDFENGKIYYRKDVGAHEIHGPIYGAWARSGWSEGFLGLPKSDVRDAGANSQRTDFENGKIYYREDVGAHEIHGPIYGAWARAGWSHGFLGLPTTDVTETSQGGALRSTFEGGVIYYREDTGAHEIHGPIYKAYARSGWTTGPLGLPVSDVTDTTRGNAQRSNFENGIIYSRDDTGAHALYGPIYDAYARTGWTTGPLGLPTSDIRDAGADGSLRADFENGIIYHRSDIGAHEIHDPMIRPYARHGGAAGALGLPVSDVYAITGGLQIDFQHGWIRWNEALDRYTVRVR